MVKHYWLSITIYFILFGFTNALSFDNIFQENLNFQFYYPETYLDNPINYYSLIHFIEYAILAFLKFFKVIHIIVLSIFWELIELFIVYDWARESWANKIFDILFNYSGFYVCRKLYS
tara:strand:- start:110 stop:463 length:354 start_codon:yes stop_codon:yes gene_type:complete